ncbi:unnamed protein product [Spirodela intermedia]|uniref:Uncharacterized protein n=1 Tax=Spirodela intermedia TaxID=51605 RepID=A0A7I8K3F9_SPIIN|nr:unnamed protein product [Spirodela intermedia]
MVFIPLGHSLRKKSSWPMYAKASPDPTRRNCGISQNTLMGTGPAAATMAMAERTSPTPMRWSGVRPCELPKGTVRRMERTKKTVSEPGGISKEPATLRSMVVAWDTEKVVIWA